MSHSALPYLQRSRLVHQSDKSVVARVDYDSHNNSDQANSTQKIGKHT